MCRSSSRDPPPAGPTWRVAQCGCPRLTLCGGAATWKGEQSGGCWLCAPLSRACGGQWFLPQASWMSVDRAVRAEWAAQEGHPMGHDRTQRDNCSLGSSQPGVSGQAPGGPYSGRAPGCGPTRTSPWRPLG